MARLANDGHCDSWIVDRRPLVALPDSPYSAAMLGAVEALALECPRIVETLSKAER